MNGERIKDMKQLEMHVKDLLIGCPPIKIETEEEMEEFGEIVDINRGISYGQIEVSEEGKLTSLIIDIDAITENNDVSLDEYEVLSVEDLKEMAQDFVEEFGQRNLKLTSFSEWGNDTFLLIYEAIDVKFNLPLPDSGVTLEMNKQGFILSATLNQSYYQLKYPTIEINEEQAKELYTGRLLVELGAVVQDAEIKLMYYPIHQNQGVTVDGQVIALTAFSDENQLELRSITEVATNYTEQELLGITEDLIVNEENGISTYKSENSEHQQLKVNQSDDTEIIIESNLPFTEDHEYTVDELRERAIAFLEMKVGNVANKYVLEDVFVDEDEEEEEEDDELTEEEIEMLKAMAELAEEEEEEDDDEEDDSIFEPFITFSFHRRLNGIAFNEYNAHIDLGIYSGAVKDSVIPLLNPLYVENSFMMPDVSFEEANRIYIDSIQLELARIPHEEEDFIAYELCYVVKEKEAFKRIERIDGQNGNIFYQDDLEYIEDNEEDHDSEIIQES